MNDKKNYYNISALNDEIRVKNIIQLLLYYTVSVYVLYLALG
jgi:hypothetical protein